MFKIGKMDAQLSIAEIVKRAAGLEIQDFENLYKRLSALRVQKQGTPVLSKAESQLLTQINNPFSSEKWERLKYLDWKLEFSALNPAEEAESLELAEAYEAYCVERLKYLSQLANFRHVSIDTLTEQLGLISIEKN